MKNKFKKEIIDNYLKDNKISKTRFCKLCSISPYTLKKILNNENYEISALFKIAKVIEIQVYQMFCKD
jgi:predicted transcriptional regulator